MRNGKLDRKSPANLLQVATVFHHYLNEARAASPPAIIQRPTLGALAAIGRAPCVGSRARPAGPRRPPVIAKRTSLAFRHVGTMAPMYPVPCQVQMAAR